MGKRDKKKRGGFFEEFNWKKATNRVILLICIGIIINLVISYFVSDDLGFAKIIDFSIPWLFLSLFLAVFPWVGHAIEIMIWSGFFKKKITFKKAFRISVATDLGSAVTPTMIGGGPIKVGMLMRHGLKSGQAAAMLTFTAIEDAIFIVTIIPLSIYFSEVTQLSILKTGLKDIFNKAWIPIIIIAIAFVLLIVLYQLGKTNSVFRKIRMSVKKSIDEFLNAYKLIATRGKLRFIAATLAIASRWISRFLLVIALVRGLNTWADYSELIYAQWMIYAGMTVTPTPGAMVGAEFLFLFAFKNIIPQDYIGVVLTAWRFFTYYAIVALAAAYIFYTVASKKANKPVKTK